MIQPAFEILNQRGTPMFFSDVLANRPTFGIVGRIFIATDSPYGLFRDTGTAWVQIAGSGGGGISGSGAAGQVTFWSGASAVSGSNNLWWDNATNKFLVGTNNATGGGAAQITNTTGDDHLRVWGSTSPSIRIDNAVSAATQRFAIGLATATNNFIQGSAAGDICITTASANPLLFGMWQTTNATEVMRISTGSRLLIGTSVDAGFKLDIVGTSRFTYSSVGITNSGFAILNSTSNVFRCLGDGAIAIGNSTFSAPRILPITTSQASINLNGANLSFYNLSSGDATGTAGAFSFSGSTYNSITTGNINNVSSVRTFAPTSGTTTHNNIYIEPTINQTGGANGITRSLYINPTLTSAADFRSIEWTNNAGAGLWGSGTARNYLNGSLLLGTTTDAGFRLDIVGTDARINNVRIGRGGGNVTTNTILGVDALFLNTTGGNNTIVGNGAGYSNTTGNNNTIIGGNAGNINNASNNVIIGYLAGTKISGGVTSLSIADTSIFIGRNTKALGNSQSNQIVIGDDETGLGSNTTIIGNSSTSYTAIRGNLLLGSTTNQGQKLYVNGSVRIDGQTSATAGGSAGLHLIVNLDGTDYKIALLNV